MQIQPPSTLLMGASGAGKSTALVTFIKKGIEVFVLGTEPRFAESLVDACKLHGADVSKLHWMTVKPATEGWDALDEMATKIGTMDQKGLSDLKGIGKETTRKPALSLLNAMKNFICERDGKHYGDVFTWQADRAFSLDSLSGLSTIARALTVGYKPTANPGEWNIMMTFVEDLLNKINSDSKCFFVLTAHVEKELNEVTGANAIMASTLGKKLAPKLPRFFSEVVYAQRKLAADGKSADFIWSTVEHAVDLKNRGLPLSAKLAPDFGPLVDSYRERLKSAGVVTSPTSPAPITPPANSVEKK